MSSDVRCRSRAPVGRLSRAVPRENPSGRSNLRHSTKEGSVYVACSTLCFGRYPLERALRVIGELEFSKLDVAINERGPHLRPSEVAADVALAGQRIRIGPSLTPAAFSVEIEADSGEEYQRQLRAICRLARLSTVSIITVPAAAANG